MGAPYAVRRARGMAGCGGMAVRTLATTFALLVLASQGEAQTLDDLAFMSGCWEGPLSRGGTIEEFYSPPTENMIVGTTRYVRDGRTVTAQLPVNLAP